MSFPRVSLLVAATALIVTALAFLPGCGARLSPAP